MYSHGSVVDNVRTCLGTAVIAINLTQADPQ